jgi:UTP--glucose-1-phosphate uridylyltransferase
MLDAYQRHGTSVVGPETHPREMIHSFGVVTGVWLEENQLLGITEFAEKPTIDYATPTCACPVSPKTST